MRIIVERDNLFVMYVLYCVLYWYEGPESGRGVDSGAGVRWPGISYIVHETFFIWSGKSLG